MKRHTITLGASTTAGGKVISTSSNGSINGVPIALEGDLIACKGCKGTGKIVCIGPRIPETWNGKQVALENDLCICGCAPPPRLLPNQHTRYQSISDDTAPSIDTALTTATTTGGIASTPSSIDSDDEIVEQYFSLLADDDTPIANYHYDLTQDGKPHTKAAMFSKGETVAVSGKAELDLIVWHSCDGATKNG
jgi:uncharacterized Zn-binding protein involved in type VI secretion